MVVLGVGVTYVSAQVKQPRDLPQRERVLVEPMGPWVRLTLSDGTEVVLRRDELDQALEERAA